MTAPKLAVNAHWGGCYLRAWPHVARHQGTPHEDWCWQVELERPGQPPVVLHKEDSWDAAAQLIEWASATGMFAVLPVQPGPRLQHRLTLHLDTAAVAGRAP